MDTRMLDVAIGLVLVLALTSLIVSTLTEIVSSFFQTRGDVLVLSICSLVGDNGVRVDPVRKWLSGRKPSRFTRELLDQPLLVSQSRGTQGDNQRPSYLSSDVFVSALLAHLQDLYTAGTRPATPQLFVNALQARPAGVEDSRLAPRLLVRSLVSLVHGVEGDWPAYQVRLCAWYDSVTQRFGGTFRRQAQLRMFLIGTGVAVLLNIDPMVIVPRLWNDGPLRAAFVNSAEQALKVAQAASAASAPVQLAAVSAPVRTAAAKKAASGAARASSAPLLPQSMFVSGRIDRLFGRLVDIGNEATNRSERGRDSQDTTAARERGRDTQDAMNDLIQLHALVARRREIAQPGADPIGVLDASLSIEQAMDALDQDAPKSLPEAARIAVTQLGSALYEERDVMLASLREGEVVSGLAPQACSAIADPTTRALCESEGGLERLPGQTLPIGWAWRNWPGCDLACALRHDHGLAQRLMRSATLALCPEQGDQGKLSACQTAAPYQRALLAGSTGKEASSIRSRQLKRLYLIERTQAASAALSASAERAEPRSVWTSMRDDDFTAGLLQAIGGWCIVGIASMLGAPFWFDLLGRLVNIRGAGAKPKGTDDRTEDGTTSPSAPSSGKPTGTLQPSSTSVPMPSGNPGSASALNDAEQALNVQQILAIQRRVGLDGSKVTGVLDGDTRVAIKAWQAARQEVATGELNAAQITQLLDTTPATTPAPPPPAAATRSRTPLRADGTISVLSEPDVRAQFGNIATSPRPDGMVHVDSLGLPGQVQRTLATFRHPLLDAQYPHGVQVHERALPHFAAVFDALQAAGLGNRILSCETLCERHIGRDPDRPLSRHTWGIAMDINSAQNPLGKTGVPAGQAGSVQELVRYFEAFGFAWGGRFQSAVDPMHFELALRDPQAAPKAVPNIP